MAKLETKCPLDSPDAGEDARAPGHGAPEAVPGQLHLLPGHLIRRAHQIGVSIFFQECRDGLTPIQYAILQVLAGEDRVDQISLAYKVALDRSTLADVARRLEERGWISRMLGDLDRRQKLLSITEAGRQVLAAVQPAVDKVQERILEPLNPAERQAFLGLLNKLVNVNNSESRAPYRDEPGKDALDSSTGSG